jgi:putative ABC transport system permease protein
MLRNYITVAVRNILKYKFFSFINIIGLVIGMTCCLLIFVYVKEELSYDKFHRDYENLYRIGLQGKIAGQEIFTTNSCIPLGPAMKSDITGVEDYIRLIPATGSSGLAFRYEDKVFTERDVIYADSNFFTFFSFELVAGDAKDALNAPNTVVITQKLAEKYFGNDDPLGKIITIGNDKWPCKVTGVARETPSNSHFKFNAIISFATAEKLFWPGWTGNSIQTYIRKNALTQPADIDKRLDDLVAIHVGKEVEEGLGINFEEFKKQGGVYKYFVYPVTDSHLYSSLQDGWEPGSEIKYIYIFSAIGIFILVIACINFMNLSTARSAGRAKEVGLRKTLGSQRTQMVFQFLSESFIYSVVAIVMAVGLSYLLLPQFNELAGKNLTLDVLLHPQFLVAALLLVVFVGLIAGSYPAFYLTSFNAVEVLKGKIRSGMKSKGVRSTLVVVQFAMATFLIIATVIVYNQLTYMQTKNLGLDQHQVINIENTRRLGNNREAFRDQVESIAGVVNSSFTNNTFPGVNNTTVFRVKGRDMDYLSGTYRADWDHIDVLKLKIKEGRYFSRDMASDSTAAVINEAAVKELALDNPIGSELIDFNGETPTTIQVIGVIEDFNFESLKSKIRPMIIQLTDVHRNLLVRYNGNPQEILSQIENRWKTLANGEPFEYTFLDQDFDSLFRAEMRLLDIFTLLTGLTIFIACLGLFALAAFTTEQRTKEIGIRKAMGASVSGLMLLLSKEFAWLVGVAIVPAAAAGWYFSATWLNDFAYRVEVSPVVFVGSALVTLAIALLTVSFHAAKAARSNPVNSLRYE